MNLKKGYNVSIFNKVIPIDLLMCTVHTQEEIEEFFNPLMSNPTIAAIYDICMETFDTSTYEERILKISPYIKLNFRKL